MLKQNNGTDQLQRSTCRRCWCAKARGNASTISAGKGEAARLEHGSGAHGELAQAQLIWGFTNVSMKHHTRSTFVYWVSWQHLYKALTREAQWRIRWERQDKECQGGWLGQATGLYESRRQTVAPYLLYETSKATVTRQMDSTCRHSKSRNLALFVWCILKEMESH